MHFHFSVAARSVDGFNDIVRHPRLGATAKTLLQWALSLPSDTDETLLSIGAQLPEGRAAVSRARQQLIAEGYVHVRREQAPGTGKWASRVLVSRLPVTSPAEVEAAWNAAVPGAGVGVSADPPTGGNAASRDVGTQTPGVTTGFKTTLPADDDQKREADGGDGGAGGDGGGDGGAGGDGGGDDDEPPAGGGAVSAESSGRIASAARLLSKLVDRDRRLRLGAVEVTRLVGTAAEWLARGVTEQELTAVLVAGLPQQIHSPAGLLRNRLERKMPPLPVPADPAPERHECGRCRVPVPLPGICRPCAGLPEHTAPRDDLAEVTRRGLAKARAAMRGPAAPVCVT
ncbi:hypothetical protein GCM10009760_11580 [Kitasatospora kazusensis]|uniref:Helix-turn-helix domain-containing protein n=1 Tax=Kitasatospora kazusensis TaxID=407974 RepID=A0ABP5KQX1_9ACTN